MDNDNFRLKDHYDNLHRDNRVMKKLLLRVIPELSSLAEFYEECGFGDRSEAWANDTRLLRDEIRALHIEPKES